MRKLGWCVSVIAVVAVLAAPCAAGSPGSESIGNLVGLAEEFYLNALTLETGEEGFHGLTRDDVNWLLDRDLWLSDGTMSHKVVREFLCKRRLLQQHCHPGTRFAVPESSLHQTYVPEDEELGETLHLRIGTKNCAPFVFCEPGTTFKLNDELGPSGFSIDLLNALVLRIQSFDHISYEITCYDTVPEIVSLVEAGELDMAIGCVSVLPERLQQVHFSRVYYNSGLDVAIMTPPRVSSGAFAMLDPFTWQVWLCVLLTILLVGVFLWVFERDTNKNMTRRPAAGLALGQYHAWTTFLNNPFINYRSWSAKLTVLAFLLVSLVIVATYTANLAAFLTRRHFNTSITGFHDLRGHNVGTSSIGSSAHSFLELQHHMIIKPYETAKELMTALSTGEVEAVVWDAVQLNFHASEDCDKVLVGDMFGREDYAIAIDPKKPFLVEEMDQAIIQLKGENIVTNFGDIWFQEQGNCSTNLNDTEEEDETAAVSLESTWVLFLFQLIMLVIAAGIHWVPKVLRYFGIVESSCDSESERTFSLKEVDRLASLRPDIERGDDSPPMKPLALSEV